MTAKHSKNLFLVFLGIFAFALLSTLPERQAFGEEKIGIPLMGPRSMVSLPLLKLAQNPPRELSERVVFTVTLYSNMEQMLALATRNPLGIFALPAHTAAVLSSKGFPLHLLNAGFWGGMYLTSRDPSCKTWEDLRGKKLYVPGKNTPPDVMTLFFLERHHLRPGKDVEIVYSNHTEIAQLLETGAIENGVNVEPFLTAGQRKQKDLRIVGDYRQEWQNSFEKSRDLPSFILVSSGELSRKYPLLLKEIAEAYEEAFSWVGHHVEECALLGKEHLGLPGEVVTQALPKMPFLYRQASESREHLEHYYEVLLEISPKLLGGTLPREDFYHAFP